MKTNSATKNLRKSIENIPPEPFDKESQKLQHLESIYSFNKVNLNRVCLQQDALMPLLQMIEYIPAIQRTDSVVKGLMRKIEENENKIQKCVEYCIQTQEKQMESKNVPESVKDAKKQQKQISDLNQKVKDMESQMVSLQRWYETKLKEEQQNLQRSMESKIKNERFPTQESGKRMSTEQSKSHSKSSSVTCRQSQLENQSQQQYQSNILASVENIVQSSLNEVRNAIQMQINDLRAEVIRAKQ